MCSVMNGEDSVYTVQQAAEILRVPTIRVYSLIRENKLEAQRDEETGHWLINPRSVHARLKELPPEPPEARGEQVRAQRGNSADFWVLLIIAVITLVAAGYTLFRGIMGY